MRALVRALRRIADRCGTPQKNRGGKKARAVHARVWYRVRFGAAEGVFSQTLQKRISLRKSTGKCSGLDSVLMIMDRVDDNLLIASRNLPRVEVVEPHHADPLSLIHFKKTVMTQAALARMEGGCHECASQARSSFAANTPFPGDSEKATLLADKRSQVVFRVAPDANKQEVKAAVEWLFKVEVNAVQILNNKGKAKRVGRLMGR